ncbi:MAG: hypothetical protein Kow0027_23640 [Saprospiraceae bacterium]
MKQRYEIHFNPEKLSEEQIQKHKNFDAVLQQVEKTKPEPVYRKLYFRVGAIAAAVVLLVAAYFVLRPSANYNEMQKAYFASRPYVDPPLKHISPQFASFKIDNKKGGELVHSTGSKLSVPPEAFVNSKGLPVEGDVTLHFREMHDFVDFFLSGIPMTYDSAGVEYTLESSGMIEVFAEQNGERLGLARDKTIGVELVSRVNVSPTLELPKGFNIYKLDEESRNWVYTAVDRMSLIDENDRLPGLDNQADTPGEAFAEGFEVEMNALNLKLENEKRKIEQSIPVPVKPYKPQKASSDDYVFELDFSAFNKPNATGKLAEAQQELAQLYQEYDNMLWRLVPGVNVDPDRLKAQFAEVEDVSIAKADGAAYEIQLRKGNESISVLAEPVLTGSDYTKAVNDYQTNLQEWQQKMAQRQQVLQEKIQAVEKSIAEERKALEEKFKLQLDTLRNKGLEADASNMVVQKAVVNRFQISSLGIWNCDRPLPPYMTQLTARFVDDKGKTLSHLKGYLVDKDRNTIGTFYVADVARIRFNAKSEKLLWLVTPDGKIALFPSESFKQVDKDAKDFTFTLRKIDKELKDEQDVREILYL